MRPVIEVKHVTKCYSIHRSNDQYLALRDVIMNVARSPWQFLLSKAQAALGGNNQREVFWALKKVSFTIQKAEIVGIIGPNGAGKSTLLKILNRITEPTAGEVLIHGRISSLLEVGTGFHPELTGRENIFFSGAILGMKRKEISRKFDQIVGFADIGPFLDTPIKRYSSGMQVRLAFSIAVHMEPDILLIDEVLAVGDISFQKKCLEKIHEVAERDGRTILFVSHNLDAVQSLCARSIYLDRGEVKRIGPTDEVVREYLNHQATRKRSSTLEFTTQFHKPYQIRRVTVKNSSSLAETNLEVGEAFSVEIDYDVLEERAVFWLVLQCFNDRGNLIFYSRDTDKNPQLMVERKKGSYRSVFHFPANHNLSLNTGNYFLTAHIYQDQTIEATIAVNLQNHRKKFQPHPGAVLVGEPWRHNEFPK